MALRRSRILSATGAESMEKFLYISTLAYPENHDVKQRPILEARSTLGGKAIDSTTDHRSESGWSWEIEFPYELSDQQLTELYLRK